MVSREEPGLTWKEVGLRVATQADSDGERAERQQEDRMVDRSRGSGVGRNDLSSTESALSLYLCACRRHALSQLPMQRCSAQEREAREADKLHSE